MKKAPHNHETALLRDQGRWEEITHAFGKGDKHLKVATYYGYDGASGDAQRCRLNEDHVGRAVIQMLEQGDTPYLLCGDFNIAPENSTVISSLIAKGVLIDVLDAFGHGQQCTFSSEGQPQKDDDGPGKTRIDTILANRAAFPMIIDSGPKWELCISDHVPLEVSWISEGTGHKLSHRDSSRHFRSSSGQKRRDRKRSRGETQRGTRAGKTLKPDSKELSVEAI